MIKYALRCADGHSFESWFQSADAFDALRRTSHLTCPECGGADVDKALMAPKLSHGTQAHAKPTAALPETETAASVALKRMKAEVEANSDYVGDKFADEARAIHLNESPARAIHGEAAPAEAKALLEDGVPILPLPFRPTRKNN